MTTLYQFTIPALIRGLANMSGLLEKASAYAAAKKCDATVLAQTRLFPDMHPLSRQVQIACDTAKGAAARLAAIENPKHEDTETTLAQLQARIEKTLDILNSCKPEQFSEADSRTIELKFPGGAVQFTAANYVSEFVLPNFYFHVSMVYALLRENGVDVGKTDYLGQLKRSA